jgi:hypothetical protein
MCCHSNRLATSGDTAFRLGRPVALPVSARTGAASSGAERLIRIPKEVHDAGTI